MHCYSYRHFYKWPRISLHTWVSWNQPASISWNGSYSKDSNCKHKKAILKWWRHLCIALLNYIETFGSFSFKILFAFHLPSTPHPSQPISFRWCVSAVTGNYSGGQEPKWGRDVSDVLHLQKELYLFFSFCVCVQSWTCQFSFFLYFFLFEMQH